MRRRRRREEEEEEPKILEKFIINRLSELKLTSKFSPQLETIQNLVKLLD